MRFELRKRFFTIIAEFKLDKNVETAANEVKEKTALVRYELPKEAKDSIVLRVDPAVFGLFTMLFQLSRFVFINRTN